MRIKSAFIIAFIFIAAQAALAADIAKDVNIDKEKRAVSYRLEKPALIRISLGIEDGPIFATVADWSLRKKGAHKERWRGTGMPEIDKLLCNKKTSFTFNYITIDKDVPTLDLKDIAEEESVIGPIGRASGGINRNYFHKEHKRELCHEPKVNITLPKDIARTKEGIAIIDKPLYLTIEIDPKDRVWFTGERYSLYIFVTNGNLSNSFAVKNSRSGFEIILSSSL